MRLGADLMEVVVGIARVQNVTMGEVVRNALWAYRDHLAQEPEFQQQIEDTTRQLDALRPPATART